MRAVAAGPALAYLAAMSDSAMPGRLRLARRFAPAAALAAVGVLAWRAGLLGLATPEGLHAHAGVLRAAVAGHPVLALAVFVAAYAVLIAACLPVALALTLVAGVLFGVWEGAAATVVGGTLGALLTYFAARSAAGPGLAAAAGGAGRVARAAEALKGEAFGVILAARLFPFMPFMVINLAAGVAAAPLRPYVLATVLGAVPSSVIYADLGDRFGRVLLDGRRPGLALLGDPRLIAPLVGLAVLALAGAVVKARIDARRGS
jgi:uncharacterized membrane protein YdjX (TVP38/TMEM64 family)